MSRSYQPELEELETRSCPSSLSYKFGTIFVRGPGLNTLSDIKKDLAHAPLIEVDPAKHIWYLGANIELSEGATLLLHGHKIGGDTDELRLKSTHSKARSSFVSISADWGTIDIADTEITSWNNTVNGPDKNPNAHRAFILARSALNADGVTPNESRMNIVNSDISYLGFNAAESYGLSWKVDVATPDLYAKVHVFGDVTNSRIHNCFRGPYTFGASGMHFLNNEIDHNASYGLDIFDFSNNTDIEDNSFHDNVKHGLIVVRSDNVTIKNNVSQNNLLDGIILFQNVDNSLVQDNQIFNNKSDGIGVTDGHGNTLTGNTITGNVNGITLSEGSSDNVVSDNMIALNTGNGIDFYQGRIGSSVQDGRPERNYFINNTVQNNAGDGIRLADSDNNVFAGNTFSGNSLTLFFERGMGNALVGNQIPSDVVVYTKGSPTVASLTYVSDQPSIQVKVDAFSSVAFVDGSGIVTLLQHAAHRNSANLASMLREGLRVASHRNLRFHDESLASPSAPGELSLPLRPHINSFAEITGSEGLQPRSMLEDKMGHGPRQEPGWPDHSMAVATGNDLDSSPADSENAESFLAALVNGIGRGEELFSFAFYAVDAMVLTLSEWDASKPEFLSVHQRLFPASAGKLSGSKAVVAKAGVDDIFADKLGLVIGILAGATGLLATLRTINELRSWPVKSDLQGTGGQI
jgi:parallel beta-helix repeat protein